MAGKILIVDDEPHIVELIRVTLEDLGYDLYEAADGEEALARARDLLPAVILLDLMIPGVDGLEVCRQLKEDPRTRHIQVIVLTARAEAEDIEEGRRAGADAYLTKPFSPIRLLAEVEQKLNQARQAS